MGAAALGGLGFLWFTTSLDAITGPFSVLRCLSGFSLGMVLVSLQPRLSRQSPRYLSLMQVAAAAAALAAIAWHVDIVAVVAFAALVAVTAPDVGGLAGFLRSAPLHRLGQISFSLYLAHWPVLDAYLELANGTDRRLGMTLLGDWLVMTVAVLAISLMAAELSYRLWETPTRTWLTARLFGARPAPSVTLAPS
jgi:peptidoglycan/LPS O-acetylase OafA/YrhL